MTSSTTCPAEGCDLPAGHTRDASAVAAVARTYDELASRPAFRSSTTWSDTAPPVERTPSIVDAALEPGAVLLPAKAVTDYLRSEDAPTYYLLLPVPEDALGEQAVFDLLPNDVLLTCSVCGVDSPRSDFVDPNPQVCVVCRSGMTDDDDRLDR